MTTCGVIQQALENVAEELSILKKGEESDKREASSLKWQSYIYSEQEGCE